MTSWFIRNVPKLNSLWIKLDDVLGYGRMEKPQAWWDQ